MILLMLTKDNEIIKEYMLQDDVVTIGRDQRNSMQIDDPNVADQHLRLVYRFLTWQLEDLSNGNTLLDNKPVDKANLSNGDIIGFAGYCIPVYFADEEPNSQRWGAHYDQQKTWEVHHGRPQV